VLSLLLVPSFPWVASAQSPASRASNDKGPEVGDIAPELQLNDWLQNPGGGPSSLLKLRGKVVLIQTFAWNCPTCLKTGIPLAVNLREANADRGLAVTSITTPAYREETLKVMKEKNMTHAVALEDPTQSACPYVKIPINPITYLFVIGRKGDVVWRGNPSQDQKGCLEAVQRALNQAPGPYSLDRSLHGQLKKAWQAYFAENFTEARAIAEMQSGLHSGNKAAASATIATDASYILGRIEEFAGSLLKSLDAAVKARDAVKYVEAREFLKNGFAKSATWDEARPVIEAAEKDKEFAAAVKLASQWRDLHRQRPALFPVARDAAATSYAQALKKFIKQHEDKEIVAPARALLESFEKAK
jgi:hypothetical protein